MSVTRPQGFRAAGVAGGLKASGSRDLALVVNDGPLQVAAAVTTSNRVCAAPVQWTRQVVADGCASAVVLNSGGANACTGSQGMRDTVATAQHTASALTAAQESQVIADKVIVCSTGLIGVTLPMDKLLPAVTQAVAALASDLAAGDQAAGAIMTTDTHPKQAVSVQEGWSVGGMAKGAGMLAPGLATMLSVITTDAVVDAATAQQLLAQATSLTFDRIDSDGCMSTNDTVVLMASGASGVSPSVEDLSQAVTQVCGDLARQLIADAEGASHDIVITVRGASTQQAAVAVARAVSRSNLLKTAIYGNDPNWGRVLSAVGTVPEDLAPYDPDMVDVAINGVQVCRAGSVGESRDQVALAASREVTIDINLHAGSQQASLWTNDLTTAYVYENSAYST